MATQTTNYELVKPGYDDQEDVGVINDNMDTIDTALKAHDDILTKIPISRGGTNATTASAARTNLGLGSVATYSTVPIANGGTGATTASAALTALGAASDSGVVHTTGTETIGGEKTFTSDLTVKHGSSRYKYFKAQNNAGNDVGRIRIDQGDATNITGARIGFQEYSAKSTPDTGNTGYTETYLLPAADSGLSANASYNILTSKSAVTVAQGGTGATSASGARSNLGLGAVATYSTVPIANGGTGATTVASARNALGLGNTSGAVPIANGGTGATSASSARTNLGLGSVATLSTVPVANGGTGATSASGARSNLGLGSLATQSTIFKVKDYTYTWSNLASGSNLSVTGTNFSVSTPSGYTPVAAVKVLSGNANVILNYFDVSATGSTVMARFRNVASDTAGTTTQTAKISILYVLTSAIG